MKETEIEENKVKTKDIVRRKIKGDERSKG